MAVVAHLEGGVRATYVHPTVCWAFSCDGGLVHYGAYLALSVEGAGIGPLAVALQPRSSSLLLRLFFMTLALWPLMILLRFGIQL